MTPAARVQAAIELLDAILDAAREGGAAADTLIVRYFASRRYAGSKDRRAVRDLVYAAIRRAGERPANGRAAMVGLARENPDLAVLFDGSAHAPSPIDPEEPGAAAGIVPDWLRSRIEEPEQLLGRAPLDLRVNRLRATRDEVLALFPGASPTPVSPDGVRLAAPVPVPEDGRYEIQDEGSQIIALATRAAPGMTVIDLCAGAGGKTLALAAMMEDRGRLIACDADRARLARLAPRAARAGATIIETRLLDAGREAGALAGVKADVVLVDAPCSGSGTWRRNPEARWRLTPERLARIEALQARLLALAATLVRPGGRLVYAVCSLLREEGQAQAEALLASHPEWRLDGPTRLLTPARDGTDGFFIAAFESAC